MNPKILFVLASALTLASSFAAPIPPISITAVPFAITAPGTYVLSSNLICLAPQAAITINSPVAGRIILDLGGFTLQPNPNVGSGFSGIAIQNPTGSSITVRNGSLDNFNTGAEVNPEAQATGWLSNIHIENVTFYGERRTSVIFFQVNASNVSNCTFIGAIPGHSNALYGIVDISTQTGNKYVNDSFDGGQQESLAVSMANVVILEHAHFQVP